jgi:hypothetical protein
VGEALQPEKMPIPNMPILHNANGERADLKNQFPVHASFAHIYGAFPTSMSMDIAAAMLLLRTEQLLSLSLPQCYKDTAFNKNPLIGCLQNAESGDWGMIVVGR